MPSPIGHALGGVAVAWWAVPRRNRTAAVVLAAAALAPDLDLLVGDHRGISHSIGAALLAGGVTWIVSRRASWGLAVALAWASHIALDWLSNDTRPPLGVMALWPITSDYYKASIEIFPPVSRRWRDTRFWMHNFWAAFVELALLVPVVWVMVRVFRRR
jgi:membrane-bound metal-dependent hydrolase YbcI (DUF457 family)